MKLFAPLFTIAFIACSQQSPVQAPASGSEASDLEVATVQEAEEEDLSIEERARRYARSSAYPLSAGQGDCAALAEEFPTFGAAVEDGESSAEQSALAYEKHGVEWHCMAHYLGSVQSADAPESEWMMHFEYAVDPATLEILTLACQLAG